MTCDQYEYTEAASVYPYWSQVKLGIVSVNRGCIAFEKYFGILANHFSYAVTYDVGFDRIPEIKDARAHLWRIEI